MKVLTPLTGSSGLDVSSANVDTINLGSSGSENSDANVDNLTVWANADFKNNITLGSSTADTVILNAPIYGSGTLRIGSIDASGSSDVAVKIGTKRPLSSLTTPFKALQIVTSLGSGSEQEILSVRPENSNLVYNEGVLEIAQPPTNKAAINITPGNGWSGAITWLGWNGGVAFGVFNLRTLYGVASNRNIKFETISDAFVSAGEPNQGFLVNQSDLGNIPGGRPTQFLFRGSKWIYTSGIKTILKVGTYASGSEITGSDRILSLRTGIDTVAESEKLYINMSGTIASTSGTLVLQSDVASGSSDIAVKVGTAVVDGTVNSNTKLLSVRTEIGGTESEYFYVSKTQVSASKFVGDGSGLTNISGSGGVSASQVSGAITGALVPYATLSGVSSSFTTPTQVSGAITASQDLRKLLYYINNGPAETYSQAYLEITPTGSVYPTSSIWYTDSTKTAKIYEEYYERYSGSATLTRPNPIQYKLYAANGSTVLITATDTITYSGAFINSVSRSIT